MELKKYVSFIGIVWTIILPAWAQKNSLRFNHLSVQEGLSVSVVYSIFQDSEGFMWFGTKEGLNKYDGYTFTVYQHDPQSKASLSDNHVLTIYEDRQHTLWVGTFNGLNAFDPDTETFTRYVHQPANPFSLSGNTVTSICEDQQGYLWVGTSTAGMNLLDRKTGRFTRFQHDSSRPNSLSQNIINNMLEDSRGNFWVATNDGLGLFDRKKGTFKTYRSDPANARSLPHQRVLSLYEDRQDRIWVATERGVSLYDPRTDQFTNHLFMKQNYHERFAIRMVEDGAGHIWVGTVEGLYILDPANGQFTAYHHDINDLNSLSDNAILSLFEDQKGDIWIGTYFGGINIYHKNSNVFIHYQANGTENSLKRKVVSSLAEDSRGNLWVGSYVSGINYFDRRSNTFTYYQSDGQNRQRLASDNVQDLLVDHQDDLWVGTYGGGLDHFDKKSKRFTHYTHSTDPNSLSDNNVLSLLMDSDEQLWIGTDEKGLNLFDRQRKRFERFFHPGKRGDTITCNVFLSLLEDRRGNLWLGTSAGLSLFDRRQKKFISYPNEEELFKKINGNVLSLLEDRRGNLWLGTEGRGLVLFNTHAGAFTIYEEKDGLPNNTIHTILEDDRGNLWLSTNKGLSRFNPAERTFRNYDVEDGLQSNQFSNQSALKTRQGQLLFGGINGLSAFFPESIRESRFAPPVVITRFLLFNKPVIHSSDRFSPLTRPIARTPEITLNYDQNVFGFEFSALNYVSPEKNKYAYQLEGFDKDWNYIGNKRTVTFTNMPPGHYVLRVKGANNDGFWNETGTSLAITILPPFWKTWWAYTLYCVLFGLALYALRQNTITKVHLKNDLHLERLLREKTEEVNQAKLQFFTNISHEFRTPLTLIVGPLEELMAAEKGDSVLKRQFQLMYRNAHRLLQLINELMDFRKVQSGKMELHAAEENIIHSVGEITVPFSEFANHHGIDFQFETAFEVLPVWFDREKMEKILYNLFSNAFKHTHDGGRITVRITRGSPISAPPGYVEIAVEDNGAGIPEDKIAAIFEGTYRIESRGAFRQIGTGIGLALTKELVTLHGGSIYVTSEEGKGSCFSIRLPLGDTHLLPEQKTSEADALEETLEHWVLDWETVEKPTREEKLDEWVRTAPLVLLVEDDPDVRNYLKDRLLHEYRVIQATNGCEGLQMAAERNPDLILSDVMMPQLSGIDLCNRVKADLRTSHIPVVLLTARASLEHQIEGMENGADAYVTKPFSITLLKATLKNLIQSRRKLRERFGLESHWQPKDITTTSTDERFLRKAMDTVMANLSDSSFDIEHFCREMGLSNSLLYNKLKVLVGMSANEFIRHVRLQQAAKLLLTTELTIAEVSYDVGFNDPRYFSRCFRKQFGQAPTEYTLQSP